MLIVKEKNNKGEGRNYNRDVVNDKNYSYRIEIRYKFIVGIKTIGTVGLLKGYD